VRMSSGGESPEALEAPAIPGGADDDVAVRREVGTTSGWLPGGRAAPFRARAGDSEASQPSYVRPRRDGARNWRRGGGFWLVYLLSPLGQAWTDHQLAASIAGTVLLVVFAWAYLVLVPTAWYGAARASRALLVCLTLFALSVAETAVIGVSGLTAWVFVAAATIVLLPVRPAVVICGVLAVVATVVPQYIPPWHDNNLEWGVGVAVALASVAVFAFTRLIRANHELAAAREEVAMLAAERERLRIARDLHDLLGHSLTTVTLKAALARRLIDSDPDRAKAEIEAVERLARESLADTRTAVAGYREVRLATELATAQEVLAAAGIRADLPRVVDAVPAELAGLFGWVVREGVTNVVRHSRAQRVRIALTDKAIEIVDDGAGVPGGYDATCGNGLAGLAERANAVGGRLVAGPAENGGFSLRVEVP
jgi:two-component system, NarL family, sensor histidine kinase DesK